VVWIFLFLVVLAAVGYWYVRRGERPSAPADLRRADDAELQQMPTADDVRDRISEAFGETRPPDP
jgi:hypothetical protein